MQLCLFLSELFRQKQTNKKTLFILVRILSYYRSKIKCSFEVHTKAQEEAKKHKRQIFDNKEDLWPSPSNREVASLFLPKFFSSVDVLT